MKLSYHKVASGLTTEYTEYSCAQINFHGISLFPDSANSAEEGTFEWILCELCG